MKTLYNDEQVRMNEFKFRTQVFVGTTKAFIEKTFAGDEERIKIEIEKAKDEKQVWTYRSPSVLTANYPGKEKEMEMKKARYFASVVLENDEVVMVDGKEYRVKLVGEQYSDPIHFIKVN